MPPRSQRTRSRTWWVVVGGVLVTSALLLQLRGGAAEEVQRDLTRAARSLWAEPVEPQAERERRIEAAVSRFFEPHASAQVVGPGLEARGRPSVLAAALELSRRFDAASVSLERFDVRVDGATASARFEAIFTGDEAESRRVDRRAVRAQLQRQPDGSWRIQSLEISGPDEADPEARP